MAENPATTFNVKFDLDRGDAVPALGDVGFVKSVDPQGAPSRYVFDDVPSLLVGTKERRLSGPLGSDNNSLLHAFGVGKVVKINRSSVTVRRLSGSAQAAALTQLGYEDLAP